MRVYRLPSGMEIYIYRLCIPINRDVKEWTCDWPAVDRDCGVPGHISGLTICPVIDKLTYVNVHCEAPESVTGLDKCVFKANRRLKRGDLDYFTTELVVEVR